MPEPNGQMYFEDIQAPEHVRLLAVDEIFAVADADYYTKAPESSRIERKLGRIKPKVLAEYFSMWANTTEGGIIVIGISDEGVLKGLSSLSDRELNSLEKTAADFCPDAQYTQKRLNFIHPSGDKDFILVFKVEFTENKAVPTVQGNYFVRVGDEKRQLKDDLEIRELRDSKGEVRAEMEIVSLDYPDDFKITDIELFVRTVRTRGGLSDELSIEEILVREQLGKIKRNKFVPNLACTLVFAENPRSVAPGCRIRFLRFDGEEEGTGEKWNAVKDQYIDGTIPEQIEQCAIVLQSQLRTFSRLGPGGQVFYSGRVSRSSLV